MVGVGVVLFSAKKGIALLNGTQQVTGTIADMTISTASARMVAPGETQPRTMQKGWGGGSDGHSE